MAESVKPVKDLLRSLFERLKLKEEPMCTYPAPSDADLHQVWEVLSRIDGVRDVPEKFDQKSLQKMLKNRPKVKEVLDHCCVAKHYVLTFTKCGKEVCEHGICTPPTMAGFNDLQSIPDPVPGEDGHYKTFQELYGTETSEIHRPSLASKEEKSHNVPFPPSKQTANNVTEHVTCSQCDKRRLLYSARKVRLSTKMSLLKLLNNYEYSCGSVLQTLSFPTTPLINEVVSQVFVKASHKCTSPIEVPYYSSESFEDICYHCGSDGEMIIDVDCYPYCHQCRDKLHKLRPKRKQAQAAGQKNKKKKQ